MTFPNRGRPGKREGTRGLVLTPLPYIVVYTVLRDVIFVVRILHGGPGRCISCLFGSPNTSLNSATLGQVTSQTNSPRQMQFGIKVYW